MDIKLPPMPAFAASIIRDAAVKYRVSPLDIIGHARTRNNGIMPARQEAAYLLLAEGKRRPLAVSLTTVGKWLGNRDHTTVLHAVKRHGEKHGLLPLTASTYCHTERALARYYAKRA